MSTRIAGWWQDRCWDIQWTVGRRIGHVRCRLFGHMPLTNWGSHTSFAPDGSYSYEEGYWCERCMIFWDGATEAPWWRVGARGPSQLR